MTIERIDKSKILVGLNAKDMINYNLDFEKMDCDNQEFQKTFRHVISMVEEKSGISIRNKKVVVEALPKNNGCLMLFTILNKRRIYRIKRENISLELKDFEKVISLANAVKTHNTPSNSLYFFGDKYFIIFNPSFVSKGLKNLFREFSSNSVESNLLAARIKEQGKPIIKSNALATIIKYFS